MEYIMQISRKKLNLEIVKYLKNGGKITKLPDGPDFRFQPYGVRVAPGDPKVDLTIQTHLLPNNNFHMLRKTLYE